MNFADSSLEDSEQSSKKVAVSRYIKKKYKKMLTGGQYFFLTGK
ncbi:hypothetical protein [Fibrobacter sp. UWEL]|nr:hypothetical protein [Fibrobacter sp. UWEL]